MLGTLLHRYDVAFADLEEGKTWFERCDAYGLWVKPPLMVTLKRVE